MTRSSPKTLEPLLPEDRAWFVYRVGADLRLGAVEPGGAGRWFDLGALDSALGVEELLAVGALTSERLAALCAAGTEVGAPTSFEAPLVRPSKIACLGKNFAAHAAEMNADLPPDPLVFTKLASTLCGHGATISLLPSGTCERTDHEAELALLIGFNDPLGEGRRDVAPDDAWSLVAGLTIANDVTARSLQHTDRERSWPWFRAKSIDSFLPLGPFVTPTDGRAVELDKRRIRAWVGDTLRQDGDLGDMVVSVPDAIAWISNYTALRPGDLILMGTPEGVGPLEVGNVVTVEIDRLGGIRNLVAAQTPRTD